MKKEKKKKKEKKEKKEKKKKGKKEKFSLEVGKAQNNIRGHFLWPREVSTHVVYQSGH